MDFHKDIQQRIESIKPDAVYLFNSQPLILFFDITVNDRDINELYKKVWSFDNTTIIFLIRESGIEVFNALNYLKEDNTLEQIDLSIEEIKRLFNVWELESGETWKWFQENYIDKHRKRSHQKRVNDRLFTNIKKVREDLIKRGIGDDNANSLVLRLIFIRYLIDRKIKIDDELIPGDIKNIDQRRLNFIQLIKTPQKLNQLFEKLNNRFNGVLFKDTELVLTNEQSEYLSGVFAGELDGDDSLFKDFFFEIFDFSIIPVEVISGIYESLIDEATRTLDSAVYTPSFLVDYILKDTVDEFLKHNKPEDCIIFEVAVGSGIFLVQSLRRIIEKEIELNGKTDNDAFSRKIRSFAENNLYGVDINPQALKVTCFSIYIALLDYLEPADINVYQFPKLIDKNLFQSNFFGQLNSKGELEPAVFEEVIKKVQPKFILGNPPWKIDSSAEHLAWVNTSTTYRRKLNNGIEIAQSFLLRVKEFMSENTVTSLIVTSTIFYNTSSTTKCFKRDFLTSYKLDNVLDLSPVRRLIFEKKNSPATIVRFRLLNNEDFKNNIVKHQSIKSNIFLKNFKILVIEKFDKKEILQKYFLDNDWMFKVVLYGNTLDFHLLNSLKKYDSLETTFKSSLTALDGFKRDKLATFNVDDIDSYITDKDQINSYYTPSNEHLQTKAKLCPAYSNFGEYRIILKGQTKRESEIVASYSNGKAIFRNDTFLLVSSKDIVKYIFGYTISNLYTYYLYLTSSTWGIATRPAIRLNEYLGFPFIESYKDKEILQNEVDKLINPLREFYRIAELKNDTAFELKSPNQGSELPINYDALNRINEIINTLYGIKDYEADLIDYVLNVSRYQFQESKQGLFLKHVDKDLDLLSKYAEVYLKEFGEIYTDEFIQVEIYALKHFIAMNFVMKDKKPKKQIVFAENKDIKRVLNILANKLSITEVISTTNPENNLYVQKDIKGFDENSFYIIKPNEYKCWHRAMAWYDVAEFKDAIQKAELENLNDFAE